MAKYKRQKVGSIIKGRQEEGEDGKPLFKDGKPVMKPDSFKVFGNHSLLDGTYLNLESKDQQLKNLAKGKASGKLSGELLTKIEERINKIPDFVRFEVYKVDKNED
jgi:hypothetical protein